MATELTMPKLTDSMEEGRIVAWKVAPGDRVAEGDVLAEVETDKAVMELECFAAGTVTELLRAAGDVVAVGEAIARIEETGRAGAGPPRPAAEPAASPAPEERPEPPSPPVPGPPEPEPRPVAPPGPGGGAIPLPGAHPISERGGRESPRPPPPARPPAPPPPEGVRASPRARKLAAERGVALAAVHGSGPGGRITGDDVLRAAGGAGAGGPSPAGRELPEVRFAEGEAEIEEVSFHQKAVIRRVVASQHGIPHFYVSKAVRADRLLERKAREKGRSGATLTHLLLCAAARALEAVPEANRSYDRGRWIRWKVIRLGIAVQAEAGLVVAVLEDARGRDLAWIADRARQLVDKARAGRLSPAERSNATFTLSNLGAFGVDSFAAVINPPSALTLAAGSVGPRAVVSDGAVGVANVLKLTLSCDHRVVDGVLAARFLNELAGRLEAADVL